MDSTSYNILAETRILVVDDVPENLGVLVDLLSQRLSTTQSVLERIFSETQIERRAELALDAHARFPPSD